MGLGLGLGLEGGFFFVVCGLLVWFHWAGLTLMCLNGFGYWAYRRLRFSTKSL